MKKIILILALFLVVACSNTELPPEPGAPGGVTVGQASAATRSYENAYAPPDGKFSVSPNSLIIENP